VTACSGARTRRRLYRAARTGRHRELKAILKKLTTMTDHDANRDPAPASWRHIGRLLATIAGAILVAIFIVHGESWAIRQGPLLPANGATVLPMAGCIPDEGADATALPVAILH